MKLLPPLLCWAGLALAADPTVDPAEVPKLPPREPAEALKTFQIRSGFTIELAAAEPLVIDPVAMAYDEDGRLYVVEMRGYSERREDRLGRVRRLTDTDGDGRFDQSTIFADGLRWATAIACWKGGVFVADTPDLFYLRDTNGDGVADEKRTVFTGFGESATTLNVQALVNSLTWGPDLRLYAATASNGARLRRPDQPPEAALELRGLGFSFDPETLDVRPEYTSAQFGLSFDSHGRAFVCDNSHHLRAVMYAPRYAGRNRELPLPPPLVDIPVDGAAAEVYRTSPDEAWRVLRTKWRVSGAVKGTIEGGGRSSGYFTSACGVTLYQGDAFPTEYRDQAFIADIGSNLLHRKVIEAHGAGLRARRAADEARSEFLTSTDNWFRPVVLANTPEGCLLLADFYREVVEHPSSLPPNLKQHLDLNRGNDRGRLWRLSPAGYKIPTIPKLNRATNEQLLTLLSHANAWHRQTAARLLRERKAPVTFEALRQISQDKAQPATARISALRLLEKLNQLQTEDVRLALSDTSPDVQITALQLAETQPSLQPLEATIRQLAASAEPRVRYQLALSLSLPAFDPVASLAPTLLSSAAGDPWLEAASLAALHRPGAADQARSALPADSPLQIKLLPVVARRATPERFGELRQEALATSDPYLRFQALTALARINRSQIFLGGASQEWLKEAREIAGDSTLPETKREIALSLLAESKHPHELLHLWPKLSRGLREMAGTYLARSGDGAVQLLAAISAHRITRNELSEAIVLQLRQHVEPGIQLRSQELFGAVEQERREVLARFQSALQIEGDATKGRSIFQQRCAICHQHGSEGREIGPPVATFRTAGKESMLGNIIAPNREIAPQFEAWQLETKEGESFLGLLRPGAADEFRLRLLDGSERTFANSEIQSTTRLGRSLMPEGLEADLTPKDFADLLGFLSAGG